ncbi:hypothetical protein [Clostridium tepidum]|jgi:hypothetical protein|uniref:hypothetical protein n=1 Tax=Clostridium tepidum TaxID=1962263 RepID=UPI001301008F|nr:hypothetical protein [Clostridium tepidum]MCR1933322.1 hypothetical protein [Clostridium tepidum]MDU6877483.1 hypothetical protein [Clostridium botulinum]
MDNSFQHLNGEKYFLKISFALNKEVNLMIKETLILLTEDIIEECLSECLSE